MIKKLSLDRSSILRGLTLSGIFIFTIIIFSITTGFFKVQLAAATTNSTINFQARLLTSSGAIVPDGNYYVEFKIYNASSSSGSVQGSCTGDPNCLWVETRTTGNLVRVADGYLSVNLGSVNPFGSFITNWTQQLWLTMNIGGTTGPVWDGEMSPRIPLTGIPYAFTAGNLEAYNNASSYSILQFVNPTTPNTIYIPNAGGTLCLDSASACGFATGSGNAFLQGGNSFGTTALLGTGDSSPLNIETNGHVVQTLSTTGQATFENYSNSSTAFQVDNSIGAPIFVVGTSSVNASGAQVNYLTDPGFEAGVGPWWTGVGGITPTQNTNQQYVYHGVASMKIVASSSGQGATTTGANNGFTPATVPGGTYTLSFYVDPQSAMNANQFTLSGNDGSAHNCTPAAATLNTNGFTPVYCNFTTTNAMTSISITQSVGSITMYIDGVQLTGGTNLLPYNIGNIQLRGIVNAPATFQSVTNSTTAFQIQNAAGTSNLLVADTLDNQLNIGGNIVLTQTTNSIDTSGANTLNIGTANATHLNLGTGAIANTIQIGDTSTTNTGNIQTIGIGNLTVAGTTNVTIGAYTGATAGTTTIDAVSTIALQTLASGTINVGNNAVANSINIGSSSTTTTTIVAGGTSETLNNTSASIAVATGGTINVGIGAVANTIQIGDASTVNTGNTQAITIGNLTVAGTTNVTIGAYTGATGGATTIDAFGTLALQTASTGTINVGSATLANTINIGTGTGDSAIQIGSITASGTQTIAIGNNPTGITNVTVGSISSTSKLTLQSGSNGVVLQSGSDSLNIPTSVPGTSQCLQTGSSTYSNLTFGTCGSGSTETLQQAYANSGNGSTSPQITLVGTTNNTLNIQDQYPTIGMNLLDVRASASRVGTVLFGVGNTGAVTLENTTNSTAAFQVNKLLVEPILNVDTTTNNLISNPGFEVNTTGWVAVNGAAAPVRNTTKTNVIMAKPAYRKLPVRLPTLVFRLPALLEP